MHPFRKQVFGRASYVDLLNCLFKRPSFHSFKLKMNEGYFSSNRGQVEILYIRLREN